jgi:hypothetical protein
MCDLPLCISRARFQLIGTIVDAAVAYFLSSVQRLLSSVHRLCLFLTCKAQERRAGLHHLMISHISSHLVPRCVAQHAPAAARLLKVVNGGLQPTFIPIMIVTCHAILHAHTHCNVAMAGVQQLNGWWLLLGGFTAFIIRLFH